MDTIGPMARTAQECALLFDVLADRHPDDVLGAAPARPNGIRIGVADLRQESDPVDPDQPGCFAAALAALADGGVDLVEVRLPRYAQVRAAAVIGALVAVRAVGAHRSRPPSSRSTLRVMPGSRTTTSVIGRMIPPRVESNRSVASQRERLQCGEVLVIGRPDLHPHRVRSTRDRLERCARLSVPRRRATADSADTRRPEAHFLSGYVAPSSPVIAALVS
jgi:aspartyl-tRNA(Asn)/glutamyl-tRNA(Gln) amidotransferase subunit A